jgi:hypothetical protein
MQSVRDHQLDLGLAGRGDHLTTLLDRGRHWLFTQHMDAGAGGSDCVLGVHRVWQGNVDGVDHAETLVELFVGEGLLNPISASHLTSFGSVAADDRRELRVAARVCEGWNDRDLGNVSKAYDAVSNRSLSRRHLLSSGSECRGNETLSQRIR